MTPLPSVETVCAMMQQEEMQREVLEDIKPYQESSALFSKGHEEKCGQCGNRGHDKERCWQIIGYPSWHPKSKKFPKKRVDKEGPRNQKLGKFRGPDRRTAARVESVDIKDGGGAITLSEHQIEQLLVARKSFNNYKPQVQGLSLIHI